MSAKHLLLVAAVVAPGAASAVRAFADDPPPASPPLELIDQSDRRKIVTIKIPKWWKAIPSEKTDEKALFGMEGFFGEQDKSPNGLLLAYTANQFCRATLARAIVMPQLGPIKEGTARQGPGWAEQCAVVQSGNAVEWRRYVEKNGRVYMFRALAGAGAFDAVHAQVEKMLDTAAVTGDFAQAPMAAGLQTKKSGEFDLQTDAEADRAKSVDKQVALLTAGRDALTKALPGKPADAGRPVAWVFQSATKFEDKAKAAGGVEPKIATYDSADRAVMVELMSETQKEHDEGVYNAGAAQYVWQYFGGETPPWIGIGLAEFGQLSAVAGGKPKLPNEQLQKVKSAVAAGKLKFSDWLDMSAGGTIEEASALEMGAWHWFLRLGPGAKKYKKQYDAYIQTLHDTGDPVAAHKAFDGVNFDAMTSEFRAWAADWK